MLPELTERHLGSDYQVEVVTRTTPPSAIYQSDPNAEQPTAATADASASSTTRAIAFNAAILGSRTGRIAAG